MGHAESNTPLIAAKKELKEETGLLAKDFVEIAKFYPALGTMNQLGHIYVASNWTIGEQELDKGEKGMQLKWVTIKELTKMISEGEILDGPTITALKFLELHLGV